MGPKIGAFPRPPENPWQGFPPLAGASEGVRAVARAGVRCSYGAVANPTIAGGSASAVERGWAATAPSRCRAEILRPLAGGGGHERPDELGARILRAQPERWLRIVPRRRTFLWPQDPEVVAKVYDGRDPLEALRERFRGGPARSPGRREAENLVELARDGFPVPRASGWCEEAAPAWRRSAFSAVWMERVAHDETLRQLAEREPREAVARWLVELAAVVSRLHARGWYHRDLYLEHWIVAGGRLVLLDAGRARRERRPRERWFVKDVAALLHSCPRGVGDRARLRFLARYLDGRGVSGRAERRGFARAVLAKARRIAAHEPRFEDRRCVDRRCVDRTSRAP
jgi:tRNA A-37 threonylcarbamoyl transferase component Bud32